MYIRYTIEDVITGDEPVDYTYEIHFKAERCDYGVPKSPTWYEVEVTSIDALDNKDAQKFIENNLDNYYDDIINTCQDELKQCIGE